MIDAAPRNGTIWIVDDTPLEAEITGRALSNDFDIETFADGGPLLEKLAVAAPPDLLILDWNMPNMSGNDVCRFIRQTLDETALPILILTATRHTDDLVAGLRAGANDFVTKAFDPAELRARVHALFRTQRLLQSVKQSEAREREARAEAETASRAKDEFLAVASHELRNPLSAVLGWARLLRSGRLDPSGYARALETIERNAVMQVQLIDDILDVSRIVTGKLRMEPTPVDLASVLNDAIQVAKPSVTAKEITLTLDVEASHGPVIGDPDRLQQVFWNLLSNATKFTPRGGTIAVRLTIEGTSYAISVTDSGIGIAPDFLPHMFERFKQAEGSTTRRQGGLGLGLSLARHLVELHGGTISGHSDGANKGSTFTVVLPLQTAPMATPSAKRMTPMGQVAPAQTHTALVNISLVVVDDEPDARELMATILRSQGAVVDTAGSVEAALVLVRARRPMILVSDIAMANEDGFDLIRRVRALPEGEGEKTLAIAVTAYAREEDRRRAIAAGFEGHVAKPVEPAILISTIVDLLKNAPTASGDSHASATT